MKSRRMALVMICCLTICFCLGSCGGQADAADGKVSININNTVEDRVTVLSVEFADDSSSIHSSGVEVAGGGKYLDAREFNFELDSDDVEDADALQSLTITVEVTDDDGGPYTVAKRKVPSEYGDTIDLSLIYEDGVYLLN